MIGIDTFLIFANIVSPVVALYFIIREIINEKKQNDLERAKENYNENDDNQDEDFIPEPNNRSDEYPDPPFIKVRLPLEPYNNNHSDSDSESDKCYPADQPFARELLPSPPHINIQQTKDPYTPHHYYDTIDRMLVNIGTYDTTLKCSILHYVFI